MLLSRRISSNIIFKRAINDAVDATKVSEAGSTDSIKKEIDANVARFDDRILDDQGRLLMKKSNGFRKLFLFPKRKLKPRIIIEQLTGRAMEPMKFRRDIMSRLEVREPRKLQMPQDQNWTDVWPAAATFKYSVVPLPLRMGFRRDPSAKAPRQAETNLELMKIPNFLHLTPAHIIKHCKAIKEFCTPFPKELAATEQQDEAGREAQRCLCEKYFPVTLKYSDYIHQGTNIRDIRSRIVTLSINAKRFGFDKRALEKLRRLAKEKYDMATDVITLSSDKCPTRAQNRDYVNYLITALYFESKKLEKWEETMRERCDDIELSYSGSETEQHVEEYFKEDQLDAPKVREFDKAWHNYRNQLETFDSIRNYGNAVRELLGVKKVSQTAS